MPACTAGRRPASSARPPPRPLSAVSPLPSCMPCPAVQAAQESALDQAKFSQLEALLNRSQMYTQFLTEQVGLPPHPNAPHPHTTLLAAIPPASTDPGWLTGCLGGSLLLHAQCDMHTDERQAWGGAPTAAS